MPKAVSRCSGVPPAANLNNELFKEVSNPKASPWKLIYGILGIGALPSANECDGGKGRENDRKCEKRISSTYSRGEKAGHVLLIPANARLPGDGLQAGEGCLY